MHISQKQMLCMNINVLFSAKGVHFTIAKTSEVLFSSAASWPDSANQPA